jgi:hypothetical protein
MVYPDMLFTVHKNAISKNIEDFLINSKKAGLEMSPINLRICSHYVNTMFENITNQK